MVSLTNGWVMRPVQIKCHIDRMLIKYERGATDIRRMLKLTFHGQALRLVVRVKVRSILAKSRNLNKALWLTLADY